MIVLVKFQVILLISSGETSSNRDIFFTDDAAKNSPSVFPYLVKLNDNGSYHGLRETSRKLENHYPELKIYLLLLLLLEIVITRAAPAFHKLFMVMGCVFDINTVHKTVEKLTFQAFY